MPGSITIKDLRNIKHLYFELPGKGVWLLTAGNGAGKSSLLACLRRIRHSNAFPVHFPSSLQSERLDVHNAASITYKLNGKEVEYAYRGQRWTPRPRTNSSLLEQFGYPNVIYIGATADRITPHPDDFEPVRVKKPNAKVISALNDIFETDKFDNLRFVSLARGPGQPAYLMEVSKNPAKYHSEKQFSLGELCILKLITILTDCPNASLVLIDELEMALHPRAQVKLHDYLTKVATGKDLTVIFSTHSVSLLRSVPRTKIILLERDGDDNVYTIVGCFPTYAIGSITIGEEGSPDVVLYVEDDVARSIVEPMAKLVMREKYAANNLFPTIKVVPIGGFNQVISFLTHHNAMMPKRTRSFALLDKDVSDEIVQKWQNNKNYARLKELDKIKDALDYLPWTPEVGIVTFLKNQRQGVERALRTQTGVNTFSLDAALFKDIDGLAGKPLRDKCKSIHQQIVAMICTSMARSQEEGLQILSEVFVKDFFSSSKAKTMELLAPKLT